jgi:hypothetical protein
MEIGVFASERIISGKVLSEFLNLGRDGAHELWNYVDSGITCM